MPHRGDLTGWLREAKAESGLQRLAEGCGALPELWQRCWRSDWMLWLLEQIGWEQKAALRQYTREVAAWFAPALNDDRLREALELLGQVDDEGEPERPLTWSLARAHCEQAAAELNTHGNWVESRVARVLAGALQHDAWAAARDASEHAGLAAQYTSAVPLNDDWLREMERQAEALRAAAGPLG